MSAANIMTDDDRWAAVLRRDRALDGCFVTGVLTTGVYCRPSCAARHPGRGNVRFFADGAAAREAGLRPRSEEHTSELQSLMRISYAVFCLKNKKRNKKTKDS